MGKPGPSWTLEQSPGSETAPLSGIYALHSLKLHHCTKPRHHFNATSLTGLVVFDSGCVASTHTCPAMNRTPQTPSHGRLHGGLAVAFPDLLAQCIGGKPRLEVQAFLGVLEVFRTVAPPARAVVLENSQPPQSPTARRDYSLASVNFDQELALGQRRIGLHADAQLRLRALGGFAPRPTRDQGGLSRLGARCTRRPTGPNLELSLNHL